jgi:uncharacterized membrane protein
MSSAAGRNNTNAGGVRLLTLGIAAMVIGYAAATHWAVASGRADTLGIALALAPLLVGLVWLSARTRQPLWVKLSTVAAVLGLAALAARRGTLGLSLLYPLPSILVYGGLLWIFARTLAPGREALVTRLARHVHGTLPDDITAYTRQVTWAWCAFFAAMGLISVLLFAFGSLAAWSLFVNVLGLPLICAMFVGEYIYRVLRYRHFSHAPLFASVWAFHKFGRGSASPGRGG